MTDFKRNAFKTRIYIEKGCGEVEVYFRPTYIYSDCRQTHCFCHICIFILWNPGILLLLKPESVIDWGFLKAFREHFVTAHQRVTPMTLLQFDPANQANRATAEHSLLLRQGQQRHLEQNVAPRHLNAHLSGWGEQSRHKTQLFLRPPASYPLGNVGRLTGK